MHRVPEGPAECVPRWRSSASHSSLACIRISHSTQTKTHKLRHPCTHTHQERHDKYVSHVSRCICVYTYMCIYIQKLYKFVVGSRSPTRQRRTGQRQNRSGKRTIQEEKQTGKLRKENAKWKAAAQQWETRIVESCSLYQYTYTYIYEYMCIFIYIYITNYTPKHLLHTHTHTQMFLCMYCTGSTRKDIDYCIWEIRVKHAKNQKKKQNKKSKFDCE